MNLKHPYEKHLAEKLVQLPPPDDPDQHWQQMKGLLDKNMPRGGGGSGGTYRWWITGTVIVAVVVGTWFGGKQLLTREQRNEVVAGTIKTVNNKKAPSVAPTDENTASDGSAASKTGGTTGTKNNLPGAAYASTTSTPDANTVAAGDQQQSGTANNPAINNNNASEKDAVVANNTTHSNALTLEDAERARSSGNTDNSRLLPASNNKELNETPTNNNKTNVDRNKLYAPVTKNNKNKTTGNDRTTNNRGTNNRRQENITGRDSYRDQPENDVVVTNTAAEKIRSGKEKKPVRKAVANRPVNKPAKEALEEKEESRHAYTPSISVPSRSLPSQPSNGSGLKESPVTYNINYTGSSVVAPSGVIQREFTYYSQAELFPDMVVHNKPANRKRSPNSDDDDATFAVGLSLPLAFPVGDQQALGYNRNAGVNTISDYIPSPHFQYHFNNKTYLQAGLQFSSPQFIRPVLLYQSQMLYQQGPNLMEQTTSISARKLYYFNLPVIIYHSPLRNFYMGTGLMYSSLLSGVAYYEKTEKKFGPGPPPQEYVIKNYFSKFKNDSLSGRLNSNEVRLIIDMSYYWSRFTVGLQYNQAFNNYVSFQVTPNSDYTFDKNKSLQFYLRYNIWEDKKRKQPKGQVLTLK